MFVADLPTMSICFSERESIGRVAISCVIIVTSVSLAACASKANETSSSGGAPVTEAPPVVGTALPIDVSILIPESVARETLPGPATSGVRGALLSRAIYDKIPKIADQNGKSDLYASLRVTGIRLDPCFASLDAEKEGAKCRNQVRLVMGIAADVGQNTNDATLHLFYEVSRAELQTWIAESVDLRTKAMSGWPTNEQHTRLEPHPVLAKEGMGGAFGKSLATSLNRFVGEQNLSRVTFITREPTRQPTWKMGGFEIKEGVVTDLAIPTIAANKVQTVGGGLGFMAGSFDFKVDPLTNDPDNTSALFSSEGLASVAKDKAAAAYRSILRVENPTKHSPNTIDCGTCHTTHVRQAAESVLGMSPDGSTEYFATDLRATGTDSSATIHAFAYGEKGLQISQRTCNETASVVSYVNKLMRQ